MIHYVTTRNHRYTFAHVERKLGRPIVRRTSYDRLFAQRTFAPGTYVFSDLERMEDWEIRLAGRLYRELGAHAPAIRVVNDPARVKCRYALLRALREAGINRFNIYRGDESRRPERFPVFLREEHHHGSPLTDLIHSQDVLDATLDDLAEDGMPLGSVLVIEYASEPVRENMFCKYGAFRIGDIIVPHHVVFEENWLVKYGHGRRMDDEDRQTEADYIRTNPHADLLRRAFDVACIDYGRVDYGMVDGEIQIYEINTNPKISYDGPYLTELKRETYAYAEALLLEAVLAMDRPSSGRRIAVASPALVRARTNLQFLYSRRRRP